MPPLVIVAATAAAYAGALGASFQFDDWNVVVDEPRVATLAAWWAAMPAIRPLLKLTYAANNEAGAGPAGFRAVNVAIHAASALLAFALSRRLVLREGAGERVARGVALAGALVFALHPVQTEAVTYVSGRSTSLAALFALASLVAWIEGRGRWLSPLLFAAALLVKETTVVVPLAILLWERCSPRRIPWRHVAVLGAAALVALVISPTYQHLLATSLNARGFGANLLSQAHAVVYLAGQLVRPDRLNADPRFPVIDGWNGPVALEALAIALALAAGLVLLQRSFVPAFGILWFFLWLAPTNSLIPRLDVANDRQLYLALLGPAMLVASVVGRRVWQRGTALALAATIALAMPLGVATILRNRVYADEVTFWQDVARKSPANSRAQNNLGYACALASRAGDAEAAFRRALALDPQDVRAAVNLRLLQEGALLRRKAR